VVTVFEEALEVVREEVSLPLTQLLPADFPLPVLTRFVPNVDLRAAATKAADAAISLVVHGAEGLERADDALATLRTAQAAISDHFVEPVDIAYRLHKSLTTVRGEWLEYGARTIDVVGRRIYDERARLERVAADDRRRRQEQADEDARQRARRDVDTATKAHAPAPVVEDLKRQAQTATAPPVSSARPVPLKSSTTVEAWKARPRGTPADADPNPEIPAMTATQIACVVELLTAILAGQAPMSAIAINWPVINARAKSDKATFAIAGFEAFQEGSVRAKGRR